MAEAQVAVEKAATKKATEYTTVKMSDGREVAFAGKRKVNKETLLDESKIEMSEDGSLLQLQPGAVAIRMDFVNGDTRTLVLPMKLLARFAGHGAEQKYGDELASSANDPMSVEDMVIAIDDLDSVIQGGEWGKGRAAGGGSVAGASIVLQAILESTNARNEKAGRPAKTLADIKAFIQKYLENEKAKPEDSRVSRAALYKSFRAEGTETAAIIKRLEAERDAKSAKPEVANSVLDEVGA